MKVVVIGAGIAGLSIGWRLKQAGADVTVLERAQPGRGATWASAGMIATIAEIETPDSPQALLAQRSVRLWPHFAAEIEEASGIDVGYRVDGTLIVARSEEHARFLRHRAEGSQELEFLGPAEARALEPLLAMDVLGALFDATEAQVDNRMLARALAVAFQRAGGVLKTNEAVVRFETEGGRARAVRTPFAQYPADVFVLAAGAWSGLIEGLTPEVAPPIIPVKGEMIALAAERDSLPHHMIWGNDIYLVPRGGRLLVGATVSREGFDSRMTQAAAVWLYSRAVALMSALANWQLADHWAGLRPGSPDDLPLIGRSALANLLIASGQFRNGILFAPAIAEAIRDTALDEPPKEDLAAFNPCRFAGLALTTTDL
ncbi:MAG: glycine oxidase ThiO [Alphaproteobacteria bacterium]|nr:glycine oxidase ThiO [Alphaproteobacteria bacterium]